MWFFYCCRHHELFFILKMEGKTFIQNHFKSFRYREDYRDVCTDLWPAVLCFLEKLLQRKLYDCHAEVWVIDKLTQIRPHPRSVLWDRMKRIQWWNHRIPVKPKHEVIHHLLEVFQNQFTWLSQLNILLVKEMMMCKHCSFCFKFFFFFLSLKRHLVWNKDAVVINLQSCWPL